MSLIADRLISDKRLKYGSCESVTRFSAPSARPLPSTARKELSQEALAERAGLNRTYLSDIERGVRNPGIKNVARLAKALGVSTARLVEEFAAW